MDEGTVIRKIETVPIKYVSKNLGINDPPVYKTEGASGADIRSVEAIAIEPGKTKLVSTGLFVEIPEGFEIQVRPRSGLALTHGIIVLNTPGTIDSDYRGEIKIILHNTSDKLFDINPEDRIAQLVLCPVVKANFIKTEDLSETDRGSGGFGHTGTK
jgi:dUTP pyrophosphatase